MYKEEDLENEIIEDLLKQDIPMEIRKYQNDIQSFRNTHPVGTVLVSYAGTSPVSSGIQEFDEVKIGIDVIYKNLKTHVGAYEVLRNVRDVMKSLDYTLRNQTFLDIIGDEWHYTMIYSKQLIYSPDL